MSELSLHMGNMGDVQKINIDLLTENGEHRKNVMELVVPNRDKPRLLQVWMNGILLCTLEGQVMPEGQFANQSFVCMQEHRNKHPNLIEVEYNNWEKLQTDLSQDLRLPSSTWTVC